MSDSLVIVALPAKGEGVNKVSSEKAAHVTLLDLGDNSDLSVDIVGYVQHAVETSFHSTWLHTRERGTLGPDDADVLFFDGPGARELGEFRYLLLKDPNIRKLYDAQEQFPEFTPHLTLGYPTSPAKEPEHEYVLESVHVDRIAVWDGDSTGMEFKAPKRDYWVDDSVAYGEKLIGNTLAHHGVKGMKWGVRRRTDSSGNSVVAIGKDKAPQEVKTTAVKIGSRSEVKTSKGGHNEVHPDAIAAKAAKQKKKKSGVDTLSNQELEALANRMNLEQRIRDLEKKRPASQLEAGEKFIKSKVFSEGPRAFRVANYMRQQRKGQKPSSAAQQVAGLLSR